MSFFSQAFDQLRSGWFSPSRPLKTPRKNDPFQPLFPTTQPVGVPFTLGGDGARASHARAAGLDRAHIFRGLDRELGPHRVLVTRWAVTSPTARVVKVVQPGGGEGLSWGWGRFWG